MQFIALSIQFKTFKYYVRFESGGAWSLLALGNIVLLANYFAKNQPLALLMAENLLSTNKGRIWPLIEQKKFKFN